MAGTPPSAFDVVVVGGGPAAAALLQTLDAAAYTGSVMLITEEDRPPYDRTVVSKGMLDGSVTDPPVLFPDAVIDRVTQLNTRVTAIDRASNSVELADGHTQRYRKLVLATGATPRVPAIDGLDRPGVSLLRTARDAETLRGTLGSGCDLVLIGAGVIGLEVAAAARSRGTHVVVLEAATTPMARVLPPEMSAPLIQRHRDAGVVVHLGVRPESITETGTRVVVRCAGGETVDGDHVLLAVGVRPQTELAEAAGLAVDDGVLVNDLLTTADPDIMAIGDLARIRYADGRTDRTEAYTPAMAMGQHAARTLLGEPTPYRDVPWSWSDQYDWEVQAAGWPNCADRWVIRGTPQDLDTGMYVFGRDGSQVVAAAGISRGRAVGRIIRGAQALIAAKALVADAELTDPAADLRKMARD